MYNIVSELKEISNLYNLIGYKQENGYLFYGNIELNHTYKNFGLLTGVFSISMFVSFDFPDEIPVVKDLDNCINKFHKNSDNSLCLACETEIHIDLDKEINNSICSFIERYVIPFFYSYKYYTLYGIVPFGERSHGNKGIFEFYKDISGIDDDNIIKNIIYFLNFNEYKGHKLCPCGSGEIIRRCHQEQILRILEKIKIKYIKSDYITIQINNKMNMMLLQKKQYNQKKLQYYLFHDNLDKKLKIPKFYDRYIK